MTEMSKRLAEFWTPLASREKLGAGSFRQIGGGEDILLATYVFKDFGPPYWECRKNSTTVQQNCVCRSHFFSGPYISITPCINANMYFLNLTIYHKIFMRT